MFLLIDISIAKNTDHNSMKLVMSPACNTFRSMSIERVSVVLPPRSPPLVGSDGARDACVLERGHRLDLQWQWYNACSSAVVAAVPDAARSGAPGVE
jgi:hypothetical protein